MAKRSSVITGDVELDAVLAALPTTIANAVLRSATRRACKEIILPDVRVRVPVRTGALRKSLKVRTAKGRAGRRLPRGVIGHQVITSPKVHYKAFVAHILEFGTRLRSNKRLKPKKVSFGLAKSRKMMSGFASTVVEKEDFTEGSFNRGRIKEYRFMRDSLWGNKQEIQAMFVNQVRAGLPAAVAKAKAKASSATSFGPSGPVIIDAESRAD